MTRALILSPASVGLVPLALGGDREDGKGALPCGQALGKEAGVWRLRITENGERELESLTTDERVVEVKA